MSDVVRNYSWGGNIRRRRRDLRRKGGRIGRGVLYVLILLVGGGLWMSRDSYEMGALIPKDRAFQACIDEVMRKHALVRSAKVWELLPEGNPARQFMNQSSTQLPLPQWLLNNLSTGISHWSSSRADSFDDLLLVTRMTRIGCLAEKFAWIHPAVDRDAAGGLGLRHVPEAGIYYAVRGRVLLVSPSRDTLMQALTLAPDRATGQEALAAMRTGAAGADVFGRVRMQGLPLASVQGLFDTLEFSLRLADNAVTAQMRVTLDSAGANAWSVLLAQASPKALPLPPQGCAAFSINLNKPLKQVIAESLTAAGHPEWLPAWLTAESLTADNPYAPLLGLVRDVFNSAGPGARLAWQGVDVNEMIPVPVLVGAVDGATAPIAALVANPPAVPAVIPELDLTPRVETDTGLVHVPLVGGPSIEPTFALYGEGLALGTSLTAVRALLAGPTPDSSSEPGNLFLIVRPNEVVQQVIAAGNEVAGFGFLRGQTPESLAILAQPWLDATAKVKEASLLAAHEKGQISARVTLTF